MGKSKNIPKKAPKKPKSKIKISKKLPTSPSDPNYVHSIPPTQRRGFVKG